MKVLISAILVTIAAAQQFQQERSGDIAVRLAGLGTFTGAGNAQNQNRRFQSGQSGSIQSQNQLASRVQSSQNQFNQNQNQFSSRVQSGQNQFNQNQNQFASRVQSSQNQFSGNIQSSGVPVLTIGGSQQGLTPRPVNFQAVNTNTFSQNRQTGQVVSSNIISNSGFESSSNPSSISSSRLSSFSSSRPSSVSSSRPSAVPSVRPSSFSSSSSSSSSFSQPQSGNTFSGASVGASSGPSSFSSFSSSSSPSSSSSSSGAEVNGVFEPLNLPSGATRLLGSIDTSFNCFDKPYGYYADEDNSCRVFHICNPALFEDGEVQTFQYSFMCGEGTVFDQNSMTCETEFNATPCQESRNFYFRNEQFGRI